MARRLWQDDEVKNSYRARRNEDGQKLCELHSCDKVLVGRQQRWCSTAHAFDAMATWDWSVCRSRVLKRDKLTCQNCGAQANAAPCVGLDVDHIVPLCEGGKLCDPANLRTLCKACHKVETAALAKRRALARKQVAAMV